MKGRRAAFLLPPLLMLGFLLRAAWGPARGGQRDDTAVAGPFLDPDSAQRARRVQLALSAGRLPQSDRFLGHPRSLAFPEPPLFDALLAWTAQLALGERAAGRGGAPPDERRLEALLGEVGPLLGAALLLALLAAARRGSSRDVGARAGVAALAVLAIAPLAVHSGAAGRLHVEQWAALLVALQAWQCRSAWAAQEVLDRLQAALLAGLVTGFGLASTPLFAAPALAAWGGFLVAAFAAGGDEARDRARAGLLFSVSAILPAQLPSMEGPWQAAPPGAVADWVRISSGFLIAGCAAFAFVLARKGGALRTARSAVGLVAAAALALALAVALPGFAEPLASSLRASLWLLAEGAAEGSGATLLATGRGPWLSDLAPWALVLALALWGGHRAAPAAELTWFIVCGALALCAALVHRAAGLVFLVPAALAADAFLSGAWSSDRPRLRRAGLWLFAGALLWSAVRLGGELRAGPERAERLELVHALRWLRANSEPSGAWNSSGAAQDYGVLADGAVAGLVPYHARRPALASGPRAAAADPAAAHAALSVLASPSPESLVAGAIALGARYLVVRPSRSDRAFGWNGGAGPAARILASELAPVPAGTERVHSSSSVTIYRLSGER